MNMPFAPPLALANTRQPYGYAPFHEPTTFHPPAYQCPGFPYDGVAGAIGPPVQHMTIIPPAPPLFAPENTRPACGNASTYVHPVHPSAYPGSRSDEVAGTAYPQHWSMDQSKPHYLGLILVCRTKICSPNRILGDFRQEAAGGPLLKSVRELRPSSRADGSSAPEEEVPNDNISNTDKVLRKYMDEAGLFLFTSAMDDEESVSSQCNLGSKMVIKVRIRTMVSL